jgi:hypothetical protein
VSLPDRATLHEMYGQELSELLDLVLAGDVVSDQATVERRLVRSIGALVWLHQWHQVDEQGRCSVCWPLPRTWWRPWPRRSICTVHSALDFHLRQRADFVLSTLTDRSGARGVS